MSTQRPKGTLKIVFTTEDLALTRIANRADLMWEMMGSLHRLQIRDGGATMDSWRRQAHLRLTETGLLPSVRALLLPLAPRGPYFPDFLTPIEAQLSDENAIQALLDTPRARIQHELDLLRHSTGLASADLEDLARGNPQTIARLGNLAAAYCDTILTPRRPAIDRILAQERAILLRHLSMDGIEQTLAHLKPTIRWRPPTLEVDYPPGLDREIHLRGRGLTLIPTYFCRANPVALVDHRLPPVLAYPAPHRRPPDTGAIDALAALLGRTRAEILHRIALTPGGCSTTELARRTGVSQATASEHAQVLRQAKLITSVRQANLMLHHPTRLGNELLTEARNARSG